jgi:hypothetical protein
VFYLADVETTDGSRLFEALQGTTFPLVAVLTRSLHDPSQSTILHREEGKIATDGLVERLTAILATEDALLASMRIQRCVLRC